MSNRTRKVQSPEAVLEGRLLAICTAIDRAVGEYSRARPSTKYPEVPYDLGKARMWFMQALQRAEVARCEVQNAEALEGLAMVNKAVISHLRGGSRG